MVTSPGSPTKRYDLFALAILLLMVGGVAGALSRHSLVLFASGLSMIVGSIPLAARSNINPLMPTNPPARTSRGRVGALAWIWGLLALLALCISLYLLHTDSLEAEHRAWLWTLAHGLLFAIAIVVLSWANALGARVAGPH